MKHFLILLFCTSLLHSCKKLPEDDKPAGRVIDAVTGEPIANAYVALFKSDGGFMNPKGKMIANMLTDASGNFSFDAALEGTNVQSAKDHYYDSEFKALSDSKYKENRTLKLIPEAFFKVHLQNVEKIYTRIDFGVSSFYGDVDTTIVLRGQANYYEFGYWLNTDNPEKSIRKNITTQPKRFDTIDININY